MKPNSRVRVEGLGSAVVTVWLDHPEKLNVLDLGGWTELGRVMNTIAEKPECRCVVVRGVGGRAFSAGSDIGAFGAQRSTPEQVLAYGEALHGALESLAVCPHPTVAVAEGLCVGGGLEIVSCCDLRVCVTSSRFGAPINRLGLTMAYEELAPLVRLLGPGPVLEMLLTGDLVDSERAHTLGLVHRVFLEEELEQRVSDLVEKIALGAPLVNRWHKRFIRRLADPKPLSREERMEAYESFGTDDYREGREAFVEKRAPSFKGQ